ncbi:hypothetical protein JDV02_008147 [Purpureocillium takamizusanense]|uniref:SRR1-like domain-containing protein n=1 Tax=Purpureocillium takamizusanense TaxID=2060973 RepID=A0A9Q8QLJ8_9HYPO|nr:uncharacterized protein JDV02_008147 [Purpureocillium takamizusanense]UNI22243.1 hypothetical protein JDV02_008147 [Purpureocillium takamizusanense]
MPPPPSKAADGDGEWTTIKPKNNRRHGQHNNTAHRHDTPTTSSRTSARARGPLPLLREGEARRDGPLRSVSSIEAEYRTLRDAFEASPCCASLRALAGRIVASAAEGCRSNRSNTTTTSNSSKGHDCDKDEAESVPPPPPPVTKAVCLGIGTFDPPDGGWEAKRRTFLQLIAFLILVEELERLTRTSIPCIFQEPIFSASDVAFLTSLSSGYSVVPHPRACRAVDRRALLYGIHLYRPVYALALSGGGGSDSGEHDDDDGGESASPTSASTPPLPPSKNAAASAVETAPPVDYAASLPAVFVGTGWDVWDGVTLGRASDGGDARVGSGGGGGGDEADGDDGFMRRLRAMEDTYQRADFPHDEAHGTAFSSTSVYWRKGGGGDGDGGGSGGGWCRPVERRPGSRNGVKGGE